MNHTSALGRAVLTRCARCVSAAFGLAVHSFGVYLQLQANIGQSPWNMLNQGLALHFPISFGTASILVSLTVILIDLLMKESIGLGTILDALVVGWTVDFLIWLDLVPLQTSFLPQLLILFIGTAIMCVGSFLYMRAGLSCGPRDAMLVGLGKRFPKIPIGRVNIALLAVVLVVSTLLGGQLGLGTFITIFSSGIIMDLVFQLLRFEPRSVQHESLAQTIAALSSAWKAGRTPAA